MLFRCSDGKIIEYSGSKLSEIFKYNNIFNNISTIYSTPSLIYNKKPIKFCVFN